MFLNTKFLSIHREILLFFSYLFISKEVTKLLSYFYSIKFKKFEKIYNLRFYLIFRLRISRHPISITRHPIHNPIRQ